MCFAQPSEQQKLEERKAQILKEISENKSRLEAEKKKEKSVLKPANTEQRIYIVGGAVLLLVGLVILAKK